MLATIPKTITFDDTSLYIEWKDDKKTSYDLLVLRKNCPCALCRGGHGKQTVRITDRINEIRLTGWKKIGRYAICLHWSDGHDKGMYTWDDLHDENYCT